MPKKVLSIRIDDDLRDKLEFIANREYRTLANQITLFLIKAAETYFSSDISASIAYLSASNPQVPQSVEAKGDSEIPF